MPTSSFLLLPAEIGNRYVGVGVDSFCIPKLFQSYLLHLAFDKSISLISTIAAFNASQLMLFAILKIFRES
jgi:hypothetical protein